MRNFDFDHCATATKRFRRHLTGGFGGNVRAAINTRIDHLIEQGLAHRHGQRIVFARDLLVTPRQPELDEAAAKLSAQTGLGVGRWERKSDARSAASSRQAAISNGAWAGKEEGLSWDDGGATASGMQSLGMVSPSREFRADRPGRRWSWPAAVRNIGRRGNPGIAGSSGRLVGRRSGGALPDRQRTSEMIAAERIADGDTIEEDRPLNAADGLARKSDDAL